MSRIAITTVVLLATLLAGAALAQPPGTGESKNSSKDDTRSPLKLSVKVDKGTYHIGDVVHITLLLKNPTKIPIPVTFASGQKYDVFILRPPVDKSGSLPKSCGNGRLG